MGKSSQRKGADGERELASILQQHGYECDRGGSLTFGEVPDITGLPGIHIEVKRVERLNVGEAMDQAIRDSGRMKVRLAPSLQGKPQRVALIVNFLRRVFYCPGGLEAFWDDYNRSESVFLR